MHSRQQLQAIVAMGEPISGRGGLARMGIAQARALGELGWCVRFVTPDAITRPWRSHRFPALNVALQSWQVSALARKATSRDSVLFSHGACGGCGARGRHIQLYHGTFAALAAACRARLSHLEYAILVRLSGGMERRSGRTADCVAVSRSVSSEVLAYYGIEGATVLPNAVDIDHFGTARPADTRPRSRDRYLGLCVGRLDYGKGRDLVRALGQLLPRDCHLNVASPCIQGDASWPDRRMQALGPVDYADLPTVYAQADYLLCPSRYEGFGLTLIEAWAAGVPVITTNVGIVRELRGSEPAFDGMVVDDPDDAQGFAERVRLLREDAEIGSRQVEWGRALVKERFSLESYRSAWDRFLDTPHG